MEKQTKKFLLIFLLFLSACGGGGGSTPDYSGTWNVQGMLVQNDCNIKVPLAQNYDITVNQDGTNIVIFDGKNTFTGSTVGFDGEYLTDGFAAGHTFSDGSQNHIYVQLIKGDKGSYNEYFYIPVGHSNGTTYSCIIAYDGEAYRIQKNTKNLSSSDTHVVQFSSTDLSKE